MAYTGPGDVQATGWHIWAGFRGFSAAKAATGTQKAIRIQRASDSAQQDFVILTTGAIDVASITTFLAATTGKIVTWYDQSGNGFDLALTTGSGFSYATSVAGLGSGQVCAQVADGSQYTNTSGEPFSAQPYSTTAVIRRNTGFSTSSNLATLAAGNNYWAWLNSADTMQLFAGTSQNITLTDNVWHTFQTTFNGGSSSYTIDGSTTSGVALGAINPGFQATTFGDGTNAWPGFVCEYGIVDAVTASPSNMNTNQQYWFSAIPSGVTPATLMSQICM